MRHRRKKYQGRTTSRHTEERGPGGKKVWSPLVSKIKKVPEPKSGKHTGQKQGNLRWGGKLVTPGAPNFSPATSSWEKGPWGGTPEATTGAEGVVRGC